MEKITDIEFIIQQSLEQNEPTIIAIDGPATSGKTTLAKQLKEKFNAIVVIPMDHFFLPMSMKTSERLAEIGGNVDYVRVEKEVCIPFINREFLFAGLPRLSAIRNGSEFRSKVWKIFCQASCLTTTFHSFPSETEFFTCLLYRQFKSFSITK